MVTPGPGVPGSQPPGIAPQGAPGGRPPGIALHWGMSRHARRLLTLALAGLVIAVITGRPEFVGVAAPTALLLATWRRERPGPVRVTAALSASRAVEGERAAAEVTVEGQGEYAVTARLHPTPAIRPLPGPGGQRPGASRPYPA